jgi:hypothetical protein
MVVPRTLPCVEWTAWGEEWYDEIAREHYSKKTRHAHLHCAALVAFQQQARGVCILGPHFFSDKGRINDDHVKGVVLGRRQRLEVVKIVAHESLGARGALQAAVKLMR